MLDETRLDLLRQICVFEFVGSADGRVESLGNLVVETGSYQLSAVPGMIRVRKYACRNAEIGQLHMLHFLGGARCKISIVLFHGIDPRPATGYHSRNIGFEIASM